MFNIAIIARAIVCIYLFFHFIIHFGYPSYMRYLEEATFFIESVIPFNETKLPFLTVWRNMNENPYNFCQKMNSSSNNSLKVFIECLNKKSYSFNETIIGEAQKRYNIQFFSLIMLGNPSKQDQIVY